MISRVLVIEFLRKSIGLLFLFSAAVKSIDPMGTAIKLSEYLTAFGLDIFSDMAMPMAILLCASEMLIALALLMGIYRRLSIWAASIFIFAFTILTLYIYLYSPVEDCGCFGDAIKISNGATFAKNILFSVMCLVVLRSRTDKKQASKSRFASTLIALLLSFGIPIYSWLYLPPTDFLPYNIGVDIVEDLSRERQSSEYETVLIYKDLVDGGEREFAVDDTTWYDTSRWEYVDTRSTLIKEGDSSGILSFNIVDSDGVNRFDDLIATPQNALAIIIGAQPQGSALEKLVSLIETAQQCDYKVFAITSLSHQEVAEWVPQLSGQVYSMDETQIKSILRAPNGYLLLESGVIKAKKRLETSPAVDSCQQLQELKASDNRLSIYLLITIAIFIIGIVTSFKSKR